jgi:hypothetical protein
MISRRTSSIPKEDAFPRLLYSDSRCSHECRRHSRSCNRRTQTCCQCSHACHRRCKTCCPHSQVLPDAPKVLSSTPKCSQINHNHSLGTPVLVIRDPSYSEGRQECPPRVWDSPEIDPSKFTLHILSDTPGGFQWLKYILLMKMQLIPTVQQDLRVSTYP